MTNDLLRAIPAVHELLDTEEGRRLAAETSRSHARDRLRAALDGVRDEIASGALAVRPEMLASIVLERAAALAARPSLQRVINATGVVLHTNLGRAPLSDRAVAAGFLLTPDASLIEAAAEASTIGK
mgnify:CR=1 FL=1